MAVRTLAASLLVLGGLSLHASAQSSPEKPQPQVVAPRYIGPMGAAPKGLPVVSPMVKAPFLALRRGAITSPPARTPACYAIRSYTFKASPGTPDQVESAGTSTCELAETSHMWSVQNAPGNGDLPNR